MSNNACRLLFRVGETHWIIQGAGFSFLGGSDVCESLISAQEPSAILPLTLAVSAVAAWVAQKVVGTRVLPVSAGHLHTASVSRKDYRELAAPRPSSPSVCLHHVPRYAGPVPTYKKKKQITRLQCVILLFTRGRILFWYTCNVNCS